MGLFKDNYKIALDKLNECIRNPTKESLTFLKEESKDLIKKVSGNNKRRRLLLMRNIALNKHLIGNLNE